MLKTFLILTSIIASLTFAINFAEAKVVDEHILIVPAGKVDAKVLEEIKNGLPDLWPVGMSNEIFPAEALPEAAYNPSSGQYEAGAVLEDIAKRITIVPATERILIVTDADIYVPGMNFVFGLADEKRGAAIISVSRLGGLRERILKEAMHECGHCRGLGHCANPNCVMYFSNTLADTDRKKAKFCHECNRKLHEVYGAPLFRTPFSK